MMGFRTEFPEKAKDATLLSLGQGFGRVPFHPGPKLWRYLPCTKVLASGTVMNGSISRRMQGKLFSIGRKAGDGRHDMSLL